MRLLLYVLITAVLVYLISAFLPVLPWWVAPVSIPFAAGLLWTKKTYAAFIIGFLALFLVWGGTAWWIDMQNNSILSVRMGKVFGGLSPIVLTLVTALMGSVIGGFSALSGKLLAKLF